MGKHGCEHGRRRILLWLAILSFASAAALVRGQSGFINIDCGKPEGYTYNDSVTGLPYTSDHQYVSTGEIHKVSSNYQGQPGYSTQAFDLRSFPDGTRNCYNLPVSPGSKYLLRAFFLYGNYDGLNQLPAFALHAGVNYWYSVTITNASINLYQEFIFVGGARGSLSLCLVNTGGGTPFVSSLELRPLLDEVYPQANESQALMLVARTNVGADLNMRYPNDKYDRVWAAYSPDGWTRINTTSPIITVLNFLTPSDVLETAVFPATDSTLNFSYTLPVDPAAGPPRVHIYLHFAEVQKLKANESRAFDITLNGRPWSAKVKPTYLLGLTVHSINPETANPLNFALVQASDSTLPPIVNAAEVYFVRDMTGVGTAQQDVDAIMTIKAAYNVKKNWAGDPCSPRSFMWDGLNCSSDASKSPRITSLNLTSSGLTGSISAAIGSLTQLQTLDLSRNSLTGTIPGFLANLTQLRFLDLSGNNLDGSAPQSLLDRSAAGSLTLKVGSNADYCNDSGSCDNKKKSTSKVGPAVAAVIGSILVLALIIGVIIWRKKKQPGKMDTATSSGAQKSRSGSFKLSSLRLDNKQFTYAYADLEKITNNFQKEIGRGGFGPVYFGALDNGAEVAVKLLSKSSSQGPREFQNEAILLTKIHHRNLVSFIGYCSDNINNLALIYEYMAEGSLYDHLQGRSGKLNPLDWKTRLRIAIEAAQGLEYLHHGCKPPIIHRDVKMNNILLNHNFEAKIADFGLSKIFENEAYTHVSTRVMGTPGYIDPEYYITAKLTEKSDVYSFGIVLLELITGLPAIITAKDNINLVLWVRQRLEEGNISAIVDIRLQGEYDINSIWKAVEIALACTPHVSTQRPNMSEVISLLKDCLELEKKKVKNQTTSKVISDTHSTTSIELLAIDMSMISNPSAR